MTATASADRRLFVDTLRSERQLVEINCAVDSELEIAEIHRRVIAEEGPALLFTNVRQSPYPVVTNLFGTKRRVDLAFGNLGQKFLNELSKLPEEFVRPSLGTLWKKRSFFNQLLHVGLKHKSRGAVTEVVETPPSLTKLPALKTWKEDGGPFITLPLVYTQHPETDIHNVGMYRLQVYDDATTGLHMQIGKGGGFHLARAQELGHKLPVNVFIGGPPVVMLASIAPLPENVPELLFASLLQGKKLALTKNPRGGLPLLADAEFALIGSCDPNERLPEGPFGDHYGYYSLKHDFPVFRCSTVFHRKDAIYPATVVGKPRQEDFFIGNYLQEMLAPLFPLVMPGVRDLWSYGETGYHSLAAAVVQERYKKEAMVSGFRILGEGQLALTKFLLLVDRPMDLKNFTAVLEYIRERARFETDLYIFSNLSMDTLDYTGPKLNEGSKGVLIGIGEPVRELPGEFSQETPSYITNVKIFCRGCIVIDGPSFSEMPELAGLVVKDPAFSAWPFIVISDNAEFTASSEALFLWSTFTRFEPAQDIHSRELTLTRYHPSPTPPIVIDCRMKASYPDELECDAETARLVDKRWGEYFSSF